MIQLARRRGYRLPLEKHDRLNGTVTTTESAPFAFSLNGFHSASRNTQGTGQLNCNGRTIEIREMRASWSRDYKDFPTAEFLLEGQRVDKQPKELDGQFTLRMQRNTTARRVGAIKSTAPDPSRNHSG